MANRLASVAAVLTIALSTGASAPLDSSRTQHRIVMQGARFAPARVEATVGDTLVFELLSGGPHNVAFDPDSIPAGARQALARNLGADARFLVVPEMLIDRGETLVLPLAGLPPGTYRFYCTPHLGGGMEGRLVLRAAP